MLSMSVLTQSIIAVLLLASLLSWGLIFHFSRLFSQIARQDASIWPYLYAGEPLERILARYGELPKQGLLALCQSIYAHQDWQRGGWQLPWLQWERALGWLATIAGIAPYVGLLGTVFGIIHAFSALGQSTHLNLATVAPGIAEALFTTAVGLLVAIPAYVAHQRLIQRLDYFQSSYALLIEGESIER